MTGIEFFSIIGFLAFVWGGSKLGFEIHKTQLAMPDANAIKQTNSKGAWLGGAVFLVVALMLVNYTS